MAVQLHTLYRDFQTLPTMVTLIPAYSGSPQALEALDDLLRPATRLPRPPPLRFRLPIAHTDWTAAGAAGYIYVVAFTVWLYLVQ